MVSDDEIMKHVQMQMQQGGAGAGANTGGPSNQNRHPNDLIDVSDDDDYCCRGALQQFTGGRRSATIVWPSPCS